MGIHNEVQKISQSYGIKANIINPYSTITIEELLNKWEKVAIALILSLTSRNKVIIQIWLSVHIKALIMKIGTRSAVSTFLYKCKEVLL